MKNGVFVPVQVDITEIKAYEAQMEDARRQAETASQAEKELLATMSYELRTPLTSICGSPSSRGAAVGELNPHAQELAENALRNSGWFGVLVNDILDMDRIELGTLNYSFMH